MLVKEFPEWKVTVLQWWSNWITSTYGFENWDPVPSLPEIEQIRDIWIDTLQGHMNSLEAAFLSYRDSQSSIETFKTFLLRGLMPYTSMKFYTQVQRRQNCPQIPDLLPNNDVRNLFFLYSVLPAKELLFEAVQHKDYPQPDPWPPEPPPDPLPPDWPPPWPPDPLPDPWPDDWPDPVTTFSFEPTDTFNSLLDTLSVADLADNANMNNFVSSIPEAIMPKAFWVAVAPSFSVKSMPKPMLQYIFEEQKAMNLLCDRSWVIAGINDEESLKHRRWWTCEE